MRRDAGGGKSLDSLHFALDGLDIMRNIGRQGGGLTPEQRANQTDGSQRDEHTQRDGRRRATIRSAEGDQQAARGRRTA